MKQATFDDLANPASLKRRFNPVLNPKDETDERLELLRRLKASAKRLESLLPEVDGLDDSPRAGSDTLPGGRYARTSRSWEDRG